MGLTVKVLYVLNSSYFHFYKNSGLEDLIHSFENFLTNQEGMPFIFRFDTKDFTKEIAIFLICLIFMRNACF